jgi:rhodanese-related sulfurtransferase
MIRADLDPGRGQLGIERAVALDGGMKAWREAGYPVETR